MYLDARESILMAPHPTSASASQAHLDAAASATSSAAASIYFDAETGQQASALVGLPYGGDGAEDEDPVAEQQPKSELVVVAQLQSLSMSLNAERSGERLAIMAMKELGMNVRWPAAGGMVVKAELGNLTIQDTMTVPASPYEMLGLRASSESSLLTLEYTSPSDEEREAMRARGEYDASLRIQMSSVQVSYWQPAVMRTYHYLQTGLIGALVDRAAEKVKEMARSVFLSEAVEEQVSAMALDVDIGSPVFLLATTPGGTRGLRADLGRMTVRNTLARRVEAEGRTFGAVGIEREVTLDSIRVAMEQMHIDSIEPSQGASEGATICSAAERLAAAFEAEAGACCGTRRWRWWWNVASARAPIGR